MLYTLFQLILILPEQAAIEALKLFKAEQCSSGYQGAMDIKRLSVLIFLLVEELKRWVY
jgi:hypothetical protein